MLPKEFHDFRKFLFYVWHKIGLPEPTKQQYVIADILQNVIKSAGVVDLPPSPTFAKRYPMLIKEDGQITRKLLIEAYRGIGKSYINATCAAWCLGINKDLNIMALSAAKTKSDEFTTFILLLMREIPELQHLLPDKTQGDRYSAVFFDVRGKKPSQAPSVRSVGIFGQMTGGRADVAFPDDVEVPKTSETQLLREKLGKTIAEIGGAIVKPETGVVIYLGTPQCEESIYDRLVAERGYKRIIIPARYPSPQWVARFGTTLEPSITADLENGAPQTGYGLAGNLGAPTDPGRFNEEVLIERQIEYGTSGFMLQFMLDTSLSDAERYPLKLRDLVVFDIGKTVPATFHWSTDPAFECKDLPNVGFTGDRFYRAANIKEAAEWLKLERCAMYIDPAGRGTDELALAIGYSSNGYILLKKVVGMREGYCQENLERIARLAKQYEVKAIIIEPNFGDGMFKALLDPVLAQIYPCHTEESEWATAQKERRIIDTLEPVMNQHLLVVDPQVVHEDMLPHADLSQEMISFYQLFYQLTRITREKDCLKHDDRIDAVAGLVNYWMMMQNLGIDQNRAAAERNHKAMEDFVELCLSTDVLKRGGKRPQRESWFNLKEY